MNFEATPETEPFWASAREEVLCVQFCTSCARFYFYPRYFCPRCYSTAVQWRPVSGNGRVASYTVVQHGAPGVVDQVPYVVAIVELDEGVQMMSNLIAVGVDLAQIPIGMPVEVTFDHSRALSRPFFRPRGPAG